MITEVENGIFTFEIVLPENPLKALNCYVIKGKNGGRNLLIDAGFGRTECLEALLVGMNELEIEPEDTDVFFTHAHTDHTGNGDALEDMGCKIYMGSIDYKVMLTGRDGSIWPQRARKMGFPDEVRKVVETHNPAIIYASKTFTAQTVEDGDVLRYGGRKLECILTPGHTPGHMCLYDRANKLMFVGDHVLFDITPNIVNWEGYPNSLGKYLESLKKLRDYEVEKAFPAHRSNSGKSMRERIDELIAHHEDRLAEALRIARMNPDSNAFELAGLMTWRIRTKSWEAFPPGQKWFAVGECLAHLEHLEALGLLVAERRPDDEVRYSPVTKKLAEIAPVQRK